MSEPQPEPEQRPEPEQQPEQRPEPDPEPEPRPQPERLEFVDTDGDVSEYRYTGRPGTLEVWCNGERQHVGIAELHYDAASRALRDPTGRLSLPEASCETVVAELRALCRLAGAAFHEGAQEGVQEQVHSQVRCDGCSSFPLRGERWNKRGEDFDLCAGCFRQLPEPERAAFELAPAPVAPHAPWGPARPNCLCVRPTSGTMRNYSRDALLHIGISDSAGTVSHFPGPGIVTDDVAGWQECVSIPLPLTPLEPDGFDAALVAHVADEQQRLEWAPYDGGGGSVDVNNCFSFCLRFLSSIEYAGTAEHSKERLVAEFGIADAVEAVERWIVQQGGSL